MLKLIDLFDEEFTDVKFDKKLAKALYDFQIGFVNKNEEHMMFFGGNLLGVQVVRFTPSDYNNFFDNILGVDVDSIKSKISNESGLNKDWVVSSDEFNLTCLYLVHRFISNKELNDEVSKRAAKDAILILQYKLMSSLLAYFFRYPADPNLAQATYAELSNRFLIKKLGTWGDVFAYRADEIIKSDSIHNSVLKKFNNDDDIVYAINDIQGRLRDMVKNIYAVFSRVHVSGDKINISSNSEISMDGNESLKDKTHSPDIYYKYILSIMTDEYTFIKEELFNIVVQALPGVSPKLLRNTLHWMSVESHGKYKKDIDEYVHAIILYTIEYLYSDGSINKQSRDLISMTIKIRNLYLSSRSSDFELKGIRDVGDKLVKLSMERKISDSSAAIVRTGTILYITLRAFTKHHYHG